MAKCSRCGKRGLFLKLDHGLCNECKQAMRNDASRTHEHSKPEIPVLKNTLSDTPYQPLAAGKASVEQSNNPNQPAHAASVVERPMSIHPDIEGLIWFADGSLKNYDAPASNSFPLIAPEGEPSAIYTKLDIVMPQKDMPVESLGYYPSYLRMTPEQRGKYILFLTNPYQEIDIGYVFVLYYGLERHLICGDSERAFDVILKLRDVHRNTSFQNYSASALIYTAMYLKRNDLYLRFTNSIDKLFEQEIPFELLLLSKTLFKVSIQPPELMKHASRLGFSNKRYITTDYITFKNELSSVLSEKYGEAALPIHLLDLSVLPTHPTRVFANNSFGGQTLDVPDISVAYPFLEITSSILQEAHNRVKAIKRAKKD